mmetsp:Transcript_19473/g.58833  ORF Transcript_19473/g.58833 Transcript_19473/m.58833 type:complete len:208 (-) Transcript_19473:1227-1850(-)
MTSPSQRWDSQACAFLRRSWQEGYWLVKSLAFSRSNPGGQSAPRARRSPRAEVRRQPRQSRNRTVPPRGQRSTRRDHRGRRPRSSMSKQPRCLVVGAAAATPVRPSGSFCLAPLAPRAVLVPQTHRKKSDPLQPESPQSLALLAEPGRIHALPNGVPPRKVPNAEHALPALRQGLAEVCTSACTQTARPRPQAAQRYLPSARPRCHG